MQAAASDSRDYRGMAAPITIRPVLTKADRKAFVDLPFRLYKDNPAWVPPLKDEAYGLITPGKNPFFEHAVAQLYLAERGGQVVGRISASIDHMWTPMPLEQGGGTDMGNWGYLDAEDKASRRSADRAGGGLAAREGRYPLGRPDLDVDLGRAGPAHQGPRSRADGDDGL
jgi:hypothetical protein